MGKYLQHNHLAGSPTAVMLEIQNYGDPTGTEIGDGDFPCAVSCAGAHSLIAYFAAHAASRRVLALPATASKAILLS